MCTALACSRYLCIVLAKKTNDLSHTKWMCKYYIVFTPRYRRKVIYNQYDWLLFGKQQAVFIRSAGQYVVNIQIDLKEIEEAIEKILLEA